jgi:hypothetical protein
MSIRQEIASDGRDYTRSEAALTSETRMVPLNSTAFVALTGNGLSVTEDLARRFILCEALRKLSRA